MRKGKEREPVQSAMTNKLPFRGKCRGETRSGLVLKSFWSAVWRMNWNGPERLQVHWL